MALEVVKLCSAFGCKRPVWAKGLCDTHLSRLKRHGHLEPTRSTDWGERRKHPLYAYWKQVRRNGMEVCESWYGDFWAFALAVGDRPSPKHTLYRPDPTKPVGPGNAAWAASKAGPARDVEHTDERERKRSYMAAYLKRRRASDPLHQLAAGLKVHGLTVDQYEAMLSSQNDVCAICSRPEYLPATANGTIRRLSVDHKHGSTIVRGLLCADCNHAIGLLDDCPGLLTRAIAYLADPPAAALGLLHSGKFKAARRTREISPHTRVAGMA